MVIPTARRTDSRLVYVGFPSSESILYMFCRLRSVIFASTPTPPWASASFRRASKNSFISPPSIAVDKYSAAISGSVSCSNSNLLLSLVGFFLVFLPVFLGSGDVFLLRAFVSGA